MLSDWLMERLPLLTKDLLEQSMQRKTYVYRALFAAPLYGGGLWLYSQTSVSGLAGLGQGAHVLMQLAILQAAITFLVVPLLVCDSIAGEKERDTLELLILTKLSLRGIIGEKFAAHFLSVVTLQLLALPLMALAYPMGGVELTTLMAALVVMLCVAAITVSWALFWSVCAYTTQGALLGYLLLAPFGVVGLVPAGPFRANAVTILALYASGLLTAGLIAAALLNQEISAAQNVKFDILSKEFERKVSPNQRRGITISTLLSFIPQVMAPFVMIFPVAGGCGVAVLMAISTVGLVLSVGPTILMARTRRPGMRIPSEALAAIDKAVNVVNDMAFRGTVLASKSDPLLHSQPVAWREVHRWAFRIRTLAWAVISLEIVLGLMVYWGFMTLSNRADFPFVWHVMGSLLWLMMLAVVATFSAGLFPLERTQQTLSVLLATPLTAREIITQKMSGLSRMIVALTISLVTVWLVQMACIDPILAKSQKSSTALIVNGVCELLTVLIFPFFAAWLGVFFGLQMRTRVHALVATIGVIAVVVSIPWLLLYFDCTDWLWLVPQTPLTPHVAVDVTPKANAVLRIGLLVAMTIGLREAVHRQFSRQVGRSD